MDYRITISLILIVCAESRASVILNKNSNNLQERLEQLLQVLENKQKDKRDEDTAAIEKRQQTIDYLIEETRETLVIWGQKEEDYNLALEALSESDRLLAKFISDETRGDIAASTILPEEFGALSATYKSIVHLVEVQKGRKEVFAWEIFMLRDWRALSRVEEFQNGACKALVESSIKAASQGEISFFSWQVIADGIIYALELFLTDVYIEWTDCVMKEMAHLRQDEDFTGFECEARVAEGLLAVEYQLTLMDTKLEEVGSTYDGAISTWRNEINAIENPGRCYDVSGHLDIIDAFESVSESRRQNENKLKEINNDFLDGVQQWFNSFTAAA